MPSSFPNDKDYNPLCTANCISTPVQLKPRLLSSCIKFYCLIIDMARKRVLALGPALSRMMCLRHPYQQIKSEEARPKRSWSWRRKSQKSQKLGSGGAAKKPRRQWGIRVGRLRIRFLSPLALLKRLNEAYVRMMLALEQKTASGGFAMCANGPIYPMHMPGRMGY